jgi:hypothetical protein
LRCNCASFSRRCVAITHTERQNNKLSVAMSIDVTKISFKIMKLTKHEKLIVIKRVRLSKPRKQNSDFKSCTKPPKKAGLIFIKY